MITNSETTVYLLNIIFDFVIMLQYLINGSIYINLFIILIKQTGKNKYLFVNYIFLSSIRLKLKEIILKFSFKLCGENVWCIVEKYVDHCKLTRRRRSNSIDITVTALWLRCSFSSDFMYMWKKSKFIRLHIINSKHFCSSY